MPPSDVIQPVAFPRGIADVEGQHACVLDRSGRLAAIALESGTVLWRSSEALRPLVIAHGEVIALRTGPPAVCIALALEAANAGSPQWSSDPLPLPTWAFTDGAQLSIAAQMRGTAIELHWLARARYRGGAAPSREVREQAARDAEGSLAVDRSSGKVTPISTPAPIVPAAAMEPGPATADVLERQRIGEHWYQLAVAAATNNVRTLLRALDAKTGALRWETTIDEGPPRAPKPLRL